MIEFREISALFIAALLLGSIIAANYNTALVYADTAGTNSTSSDPTPPPTNSTSTAPTNSTSTAPTNSTSTAPTNSTSPPPPSNDTSAPLESTVTLEHSAIEINSPVEWVQTVTLSDQADVVAVELPADAQEVSVVTDAGQSVDSSAIVEDPVVADTPVVTLEDVSEVLQDNADTRLVAIEEPANGYDIAYETPAPYTIEEEHSTHELYQKDVTVTHDSALHYTDVKSYSDIPEQMILQGTEISLYWMVNGAKTDVTSDERFAVTLVDTDSNGIADQMQWIVPQLSEQQFVIEVIIPPTNAEHFDSNGNFVEDVYDQVIERDGTWTSEIPAGDFIRVIFEQPLSSANDITIFARSSLNGTVEVYEKDSNVLVAAFDTISADALYRIYLTNLAGSQDAFDLKVVGNAVEFDKIVDPTFTVTLSPIADVSRSLWTSSGTATGCSNTTHFACVDDPPSGNDDGTLSLIQFTGNNANDRFDIPTANIPSNAKITSVILNVVADKASGSGTGHVMLRVIPPSGTIADSDQDALTNFNNELTYDVTSFRSWVPGDFNGQITDIAILTPTSGNTKNVRVTQMWLEVTYNTQTISGTKFNDLNGNGVKNVGEPGLSGWTIEARNATNNVLLATNTTDGSGNYQFTNLAVGTYKVSEVAQAGWTQTTANPPNVILASGTAATGVNFGNFQKITISGIKFNDLDGDGVKDGGEPGVSSVTINLDRLDNGVGTDATTTTDGSGNYAFADLGPGTYRIREVAPAGSVQTTANPADILASSGTNVNGVNFGNFQTATISGVKFNDTDGDGIKEAGENGLAGWTIQLDKSPFGSVDQTAITDVNGNYTFQNLGPGTYRIREVAQAGWTQTTTNPADIMVTSPGTNVPNVNFGNFENVVISGFKIEDVNGNGVQDVGEGTLNGWKITITGPNGFSASDTTNPTYTFSNLGPGTYTLSEDVKPHWVETFPSGSGTYTVTVSSGTDVTGLNFGNFNLNTISGVKFNDLNGNGVRDSGEPTLPGWTINLLNGTTNALISSTVTDGTGAYTFSDLGVGSYTINEVLKAGWTQTAPAGGSYSVAVTTSGTSITGKDFGNFKNMAISGMKFDDLNNNGIKEITEVGLPGWTIELDRSPFGSVDQTASTDATGNYTFQNLGPGTYRIREVAQAGWTQTTTNPADIAALSGTNVTNINFGNMLQVGSISGMKFEDHNGDGVKDGSDQGLPGWHIQLHNATTNAQIGSDAITDVNGNYQFGNLLTGTYKVVEVLQSDWTQTAPASGSYLVVVTPGADSGGNNFGNFRLITISGMKFEDTNGDGSKVGDSGLSGWVIRLFNATTNTQIATNTTDSSGNYQFGNLGPGQYAVREVLQSDWTQTTVNPSNVTASSGVDVSGKDFGNFKLGEIGGFKFNDFNGDGIKQAGEPLLPGWNITLSGPINTWTLTNATGFYNFTGLTVGTYTVGEKLQAGWTQTKPTSPGTYTVVVASGTNSQNNEFGNFKNIAISGQKFEDHNGDGVKDGSDQGLEGWTINLFNGTNTLTDTTDSSGLYEFADLPPGTYTVTEVNQPGWTQTTINPAPIIASSGTDVVDVDFGNFHNIRISGMKFNDLDGDGTNDGATDPGLPGWTIRLFNAITNTQIATNTTDSSGNYQFGNLGPGQYAVREVLQSDWTQTTVNPSNVTASSGVNVPGKDFGNFELFDIKGVKFDDTNGDGIRDGGEPGTSGVTINLDNLNNGAGTDATTTTGTNGLYSFTDLGPGTYRIREVLPAGTIQTTANPADIAGQSGLNVSDIKFGNFKLIVISGLKFEDHNGNGIKDGIGDQGLSGWHIQLLNATTNAQIGADSVTDGSGNYQFSNVGPGSYKVVEVLQVGWTRTFPTNGTYAITAFSGQDVPSKVFGNFKLGKIGGIKFNDLNGDGIKQAGEPPLPGWNITLSGPITTWTLTNATGFYNFTGLTVGTYIVGEKLQTGWTQTKPSTSGTYTIAVESGTNSQNNEFGNFKNISITGKKFNDLNGDKSDNDGTNTGLSGWTMELRNSANTIVATVLTNGTGYYKFTNVGPGTYTITEVLPSDWHQTYPRKYPALPGWNNVTAVSGNDETGRDFGNIKAITLTGFYSPVDMGNFVNTVRGGSTVPLKFEAFYGTPAATPAIAPNELTNTNIVQMLQKKITCGVYTGLPSDEIEVLATGGTVLRYDSTAGQFIYNWQTPKQPDTCWEVTLTLIDGSTLLAHFRLR